MTSIGKVWTSTKELQTFGHKERGFGVY